jgi:hypothetical protein
MATKVSTIEIDMTQLDEILRRIDANELTEGDCEALRTLCKAYVQLCPSGRREKRVDYDCGGLAWLRSVWSSSR